MRGLRSTLALLVVAVALGSYAYFIEADRPPVSTADELVPVFEFESDDIITVTVTAENGDRTRVNKADARWRLVEPFEGNVDVTAVVGLTSSLATLEMQRIVAEPEDELALETFGLAEPRISLEVETSTGVEATLLIGARTPTGGDVYATLAGSNRVFLVSGYLDDTFNQTTFDLRDKRILDFTNDEVTGLAITGDEVAVQLRKSDNRWTLTFPIEAHADTGTSDGLVGRLSTDQIASVEAETADDLTPYGLATPRLQVEVQLTGSTATLSVGSQAGPGRIYARDGARDLVFTIDETLVADLTRDAVAYRRRDLFGFRPFNAVSLGVERDGHQWSFEKTEAADGTSTWRQLSPDATAVDEAPMEDLLAKLSNLRADEFVDSRDNTGLDAPVARIRVSFTDREDNITEERVIVGHPDGDGTNTNVFAVSGDEPGAARLNTEAWNDAIEALETLSDAPGTTPS